MMSKSQSPVAFLHGNGVTKLAAKIWTMIWFFSGILGWPQIDSNRPLVFALYTIIH